MKYQFDTIKPKYYKSIYEYRNELLMCESHFDGCSNLQDYDDIEEWDFNTKLFEQEATLPPGYSIGFEYLYSLDGEVVGMINLRPKALEHIFLKQYGGHIGYSIKPSKRGKGIGTKMLHDFLLICKEDYNMESVLITCLKDNDASRKVILNNGGVYESEVLYPPENKMLERYWIEL